MTDTVKDAYRIVFNDMMNSECGLLVGKYKITVNVLDMTVKFEQQ